MAGYIRQDTGNNINDGNVINATTLDNEFDALVAAFSSSSGHSHDGTTAEGPPIEVTGPAQEYLSGASSFSPKTNDVYTLGTSSLRWSNVYATTITTVSINITNGLTVASGGTGATDATNARANLGLEIGSDVQAFDDGLESISGLVTVADRMIYTTASDTYAVTTITAQGRALVAGADAAAQRTTMGLGTISTQASNNVSITGGSITGITDLAIADGGTGASSASDARTNLGLEIGTDVQAHDSDLDTYASNALSSAELSQLRNINSVTISNSQWGYLGAMDEQPIDETAGDNRYARLSSSNTLSGKNTFTGDVEAQGAVISKVSVRTGLGGTQQLRGDTNGAVQDWTATSSVTVSTSNMDVGEAIYLRFDTGGNSITWDSDIEWENAGGTSAPNLDIITAVFIKIDSSTVIGNVVNQR